MSRPATLQNWVFIDLYSEITPSSCLAAGIAGQELLPRDPFLFLQPGFWSIPLVVQFCRLRVRVTLVGNT